MFFSNHEGGLWIGARAIKAKWNGAYDDSTPFMDAFATSLAEIHRGPRLRGCAIMA
jgi:hypothetical protein